MGHPQTALNEPTSLSQQDDELFADGSTESPESDQSLRVVEGSASPGPIPDVGHSVVFFARPSERRQGRDRFPALVLASNPDGMLSLLVFYDVEDVINYRSVPQKVGDEFGWALPRQAIVRDPLLQRVGDALFGDCAMPETSVLRMIYNLAGKVEELTGQIAELQSRALTARKANVKTNKTG